MSYKSDLDELPEDRPGHWYTKELKRAEDRVSHHKEWLVYFKKKISLLRKLYKQTEAKKNGRITKTIKTA